MAHENATPRPWLVEDGEFDGELRCIYGGPVETLIAEMQWCRPEETIEADAALIVEAVNAYDTLRDERDALREENEKAAKLVKLCKGFVDKHRISCAEATAEDRVYENAPELVERIAKIVGFYEYPEDEE